MALWSGRFSSDPREDVALLSESISFDRRLYAHDIMGSKAHVAMLAKQGITAKSAVICAGARKPGGLTENTRVYLSPISTATLMQRAHEKVYDGQGILTAQAWSSAGQERDEEMER